MNTLKYWITTKEAFMERYLVGSKTADLILLQFPTRYTIVDGEKEYKLRYLINPDVIEKILKKKES